MKTTSIAIGSDHRGFELKNFLLQHNKIGQLQISWHDVGTNNRDRTDYPIYAQKLSILLQNKSVDVALGICGTGIGMAIAANRFSGIFAGVAWSPEIARLAKEDDNVNFLVLPADFVTQVGSLKIIDSWLSAKFKEGRYQERIDMINKF